MAVVPKILAIVGPTAVGKSTLAVRLAQELGGEIVSADSRQVYRQMDIGTGKLPVERREAVPHHLIDIIDPDQEYSLALFLRQARAAIEAICARSLLPIVVGGTGQYVWGLLEGWQVPAVPPDPELRARLNDEASLRGATALHGDLASADPDAARRIDPRNVRRVVRALEVVLSSSVPRDARPLRQAPSFQPTVVGLTLERASLNARIDDRVEEMIEAGWVGEVKRLLSRGYSLDLPSLSSLGYREIGEHLRGERPLEDAVSEIKRRTRRFAKQQHGWFRPGDGRVRWFEGSDTGLDAATAQVVESLC